MNQNVQQLMASVHALRLYLESIHPALPAAILVAVIWLAQYLVRRFAPLAWETMANLPFNGARPAATLLRKVWQALPSIATGAFLTSLTGDGSITDAVFGAVAGALAPVLHELLKAAPVPYVGGSPPAASYDLPIPPGPDLRASADEITQVEQPIPQRPSDRAPKV